MAPKPRSVAPVAPRKRRRGIVKKTTEQQSPDSIDLVALQHTVSQLQTQLAALTVQQPQFPVPPGSSPSVTTPALIDLSIPEPSTSFKPPSNLCLPTLDNPTLKLLSDRHGFINLHKLLPVNRGVESVSDQPMYVPDNDGKLIPTTTVPNRRKIDTFNSWLDAFLLFARYRVYYHPSLALALFAYIDIIRGLSVSRPLLIWLEYDRRFRDKMSNRDISDNAWFVEDSSVIAEVMRTIPLSYTGPLFQKDVRSPPPPVSAKPPFGCYLCRSSEHYANVCPQRRNPSDVSAPAQRSPTALSSTPRCSSALSSTPRQPFRPPRVAVCRDYNAGRCSNPCPGRRLHICDECFDATYTRPFHSSSTASTN
ncbi:uncharacterized protein LOC129599159 [Paramacrobiotus metropolitanus]|uniref:uncharacterized protein LOC129599159 n=1 Tax=Paramacrobiotus metropolitanus TaxID=2943436 RepID=UPI002445DF96|nr:uncharacterized protein LOC129599159 [Paramacrobiotus metropolitanus]